MKNWILFLVCVAGFIGQMIYITINLLNKPPITERNKNRLGMVSSFMLYIVAHSDKCLPTNNHLCIESLLRVSFFNK